MHHHHVNAHGFGMRPLLYQSLVRVTFGCFFTHMCVPLPQESYCTQRKSSCWYNRYRIQSGSNVSDPALSLIMVQKVYKGGHSVRIRPAAEDGGLFLSRGLIITYGSWTHCWKEASQCDVLCYKYMHFDTYQPHKHCCTPVHGRGIPWWRWPLSAG